MHDFGTSALAISRMLIPAMSPNLGVREIMVGDTQTGLKVGDVFTVPDDGHGNPVRVFDRATRAYVDGELQTWKVISIESGKIRAKPIWAK